MILGTSRRQAQFIHECLLLAIVCGMACGLQYMIVGHVFVGQILLTDLTKTLIWNFTVASVVFTAVANHSG